MEAIREQKSSPFTKAVRLLLILIAISGLALCIPLPLAWGDQVTLSVLTVIVAIVLSRLSKGQLMTLVLTFISLFCTFRYAYWRWATTLRYLNDNGWQVDYWSLGFALMLLTAESYAVVVLVLGYFQTARPLMRKPVPLPENVDAWPVVDVFIPTYNEPLEVVRPTVLGALGIDWPGEKLRVYILDDGRRHEFQAFAEECGVGYMTRFDNAHAKAGNINSALAKTDGEYVAIFDCDHIATRSFLQMTMGWFLKDSRLGMVQTPHHFYSPDPFERNLGVFRSVPNEGALFYGIVQEGSDLWNASFFCGSCAVIRRTALEEIGGIAVETVTEDAHTSLRMQRRGWNTAFLGIPQAAGLATGSLAAHIGQRIRWARGMVQILRTDCPLFATGLKLSQRLCYFNSVIHYLYGIPRLIFLTAPLVYLILGKSNLYGYLWEILAYAAPHLILASMTNSRVQGKCRHSFWNEVYETVLAPYIALPTTLALINPKWGKFNVTSKGSVVEERFFDFKVARPYLFLIALNVIGIALAVPRYLAHGDPSGVLAINVFWASLNTLLLGTSIAVSIESRQQRSNVRIAANLPVTLSLSTGNAYDCRLVDISEGGLALRPERKVDLRPGTHAEVMVRSLDVEEKFAVLMIHGEKNVLRFQFTASDLDQQRALTRIVYSRADSWLNWTEGQNEDRILQSLFQIIGIGFKGLLAIPGALIQHVRRQSKESRLAALGEAVAPVILLALLFSVAFSARGADLKADQRKVETTTNKQPGSLSFHDKQDFTALGQQDSITLRGDDNRYLVHFSVPSTKIISDGELTIRYAVSTRDDQIGPAFEVNLNGTSVSSVSPQASQPDPSGTYTAKIALPSDLFVHDNAIAFQMRCAGPCTNKKNAWLRIESFSELETSGLVLPLPNRLSILPAPFFDSSVQRTIELPLAFASDPDRHMLEAAGIVSSWYGDLADYRGTHFPVAVGEIPKGNVILFAQTNSSLVANLGLTANGPAISLRDNPADPYGKVLVLTGRTSDEVLIAARALALGQFDQKSDSAEIADLQMPSPRAAYDAPKWLPLGPFVKLAQTAPAGLLKASDGNPAKVYFRLPPDLYFGPSNTLPLHLEYRISGLNPNQKAEVAITLNGEFVASRQISISPSDSDTRSQSFAIPSALLYSSNTLAVSFRPIGFTRSREDAPLPELTVSRSTELGLPHVSHFVKMPRMDLFASAGFPFTRFADLRKTAVVLPDRPTNSEIEIYLDALGFLGAQTGYPGLRMRLLDGAKANDESDCDLLVIGSGRDQSLFSTWANALPVQIGADRFTVNGSIVPWFGQLKQLMFSKRTDRSQLAEVLNSETRPDFVLEQFSAGMTNGTTRVIIASTSAENGSPIFAALASAAKDGNLKGGVLVLQDRHLRSFLSEAPEFYIGRADSLVRVQFWLTSHVWFMPLLVAFCAFVLARRWGVLLEHFASKRIEVGA